MNAGAAQQQAERILIDAEHERYVKVTEQLPRPDWQSKYAVRFYEHGREVGLSFADTRWGVRRVIRRFHWSKR